MRTKLLRALAHLKAAAVHLDAAQDILWRANLSGVSDAFRPAREAVSALFSWAKGRYADEVGDAVKPAELPK